MTRPITLDEHRAAGHTVTRYVATYINADGMRTLTSAMQGRHTYATPEEAQHWIDAVLANTASDTIASVFGADPRFEVRACECWAGHFDPVRCYFD